MKRQAALDTETTGKSDDGTQAITVLLKSAVWRSSIVSLLADSYSFM